MRFIQELKKYDSSLTIPQLIDKIEREQLEAVKKEEEDFHRLVGEFKNIYLKRVIESPIFGETLQILYVEKITNKQRTTDWEYVYFIKGNKITFAKNNLFFREFSEDSVGDTLSEYELKQMEVISPENYYKYLNEYKKIESVLDSLIKGSYDFR